MALKYPSANGNWSNAANWNGGTLPVAGDDVRANGFTVTIDVDINVSQISNNQLLPAAANGSFVVSTNRTLTCDIIAGAVSCLTSSVGNTVNIIGNISQGSSFGVFGINFTNAGSILNVTGNIVAPSGGGGSPCSLNSSGRVNFVGNANAGPGTPSNGVAINITASGILTFTGNATGGASTAGSFGILCIGNSTLNGTINGGTNALSHGVRLTGGVHTVNSDCFGGGVAGSNAVQISTATATFNGNITGSSTSSGSLAINVTDSVSNVVVSQITFGSLGTVPVSGFIKFKNIGPTITVLKANNATQQLVDPATTDIPIVSNVRDGIVYASGSLTGTLKVPPPTAVSVGVPTDNVVGTAVITITDLGNLLASFQV